jgi:hypothetical protein
MMANRADTKAKAKIIATRQMLAATREKGFRTTGSALDAIYGNLATTSKGIAASQTVANARTAAALERISGRTDRRVSGIARRAGAQERNLFGAVAGAAADRQTGVLEAAVSASKATLKGERQAGAVGIRGAADVVGIIQAGAKEARAGAAGQLADALQYRAKQDASIVAEMQKARLDANLQFQTWKRQQQYLAKQEAADKTGSLGGVVTVTQTATEAATWMRKQMAANPGWNAMQLAEAYSASFPSDPNAAPMLTLLAQRVWHSVSNGQTIDGYTREDEAHDIQQAVHTLYPNFGKHRDDINRTITQGLRAGYADVAATAAEEVAASTPSLHGWDQAGVDQAASAKALQSNGDGTYTDPNTGVRFKPRFDDEHHTINFMPIDENGKPAKPEPPTVVPPSQLPGGWDQPGVDSMASQQGLQPVGDGTYIDPNTGVVFVAVPSGNNGIAFAPKTPA